MKIELILPIEVSRATDTLENKGFSAYIVGGCIRDLLANRDPKDWDIATSAKPEQIAELFTKTVYENKFGTVTVVNEEIEKKSLRNIEVTPFRTESGYSDSRHPDEVSFTDKIEDDLSRRDFTINALAYRPTTGELIDLYNGLHDLKNHEIRAVGDPDERFTEDPLRLMRAVRIGAELGFTINIETGKSIEKHKDALKNISRERVRDELVKLLLSDRPMAGLDMLTRYGLMENVIRETLPMIGEGQNGSHIYDVWEHTLRTVQHSADKGWPLEIRLASLFHDIGKPKTKRWSAENKDWTFYGHEVVGARMAEKIMKDLRFSNDISEKVVTLVRNHMFFSDVDQITLSAVRRIVAKVGAGDVWNLVKLRICDRIGMGRPKEEPYRLRKYESMIEEAMRAPTSVGMLKIDGNDLMSVLHVKPGPMIGDILHALLDEALEDPTINTREILLEKAKGLSKLSEKELKELGQKGKEAKEEKEAEEIKKIQRKYKV